MAFTILWIALKGLGFVGVVGLLMRFVLPWLTQRLAYSQEMLTLFSISWTVILSMISDYLGFSKEVGAFLAGVSLASTEYRDAIGGRLTSLRDFLLLFFFIDLGARLDWSAVGSQIGPAILLSFFVLVGNPLIVLAIMGFMGYRRRTSFLAGLTVAQISEFSLIVAALGLSLGHITTPVVGLITLVGVVTILVSTYMILYSGPLYQLLSNPLKIFEKKNPQREAAESYLYDAAETDAILVGLGAYGGALAEHLLRRRKRIIAVDFDPTVLKKWRERGVSVLYGDMGDPEIHEKLPLDKTRWIVSTVRIRELNLALLQMLKNRNYRGNVALTAAAPQDAEAYEKAGIQVIFRPYLDVGEQAADALTHAMDVLPRMADWKIQYREVRLPAGSVYSGQRVKALPLRSQSGVSILAITRAGRHYFDPEPNFRIYPGDRLILTGALDDLRQAEKVLQHVAFLAGSDTADGIRIEEVKLGPSSVVVGRTLGETAFRQRYGISVIGIVRREKRMNAPGPDERLCAGDGLIILGDAGSIEAFRSQAEGGEDPEPGQGALGQTPMPSG
jgi:Trk K+ transport system NAD-binding subunit